MSQAESLLCDYCKNNHRNPEVICHARKGGDTGCTCECVTPCDCECTWQTPKGTPPIMKKESE